MTIKPYNLALRHLMKLDHRGIETPEEYVTAILKIMVDCGLYTGAHFVCGLGGNEG